MAHRMVLPPLVRAAREAPPAAERTRRQLVDALLQEHERLTALIGWAHGYGDDDSSRLVIASSVLDEYTSLPISSVVEATTGDMTARVIHHLEDWYYHRYDHRVVEVIEEVSDYVGLHGVRHVAREGVSRLYLFRARGASGFFSEAEVARIPYTSLQNGVLTVEPLVVVAFGIYGAQLTYKEVVE
jgi:hypothetical protein